MTDKQTQELARQSNMEKDPDDWVTGDQPMTGAQRSYLKTLSEEAKVPFDDQLTKAEASRRIDELQAITGRGTGSGGGTTSAARTGADDEGTAASGASPRRAVDQGGTSAREVDETKSPLESLGEAVSAPILDAGSGTSGKGDGSRTAGGTQRDEPARRR